MMPKLVPMKEVTQAAYHEYLARFPERRSSRTGICEPPQEHCVDDGVLIGRIVLNDAMVPGEVRQYYIRDESPAGSL